MFHSLNCSLDFFSVDVVVVLVCGPYPFRLKQRFLKRMKEDDVMRDVESLIHFFPFFRVESL